MEELPNWEDESWCTYNGFGFNGQTCFVPEGHIIRFGNAVPLDPDALEYIVEIEEGCLCEAIFLSARFSSGYHFLRFEGVYENKSDHEVYSRLQSIVLGTDDWSTPNFIAVNHLKYWEPGYHASFTADSINLHQMYGKFSPCFFQAVDYARGTDLMFYHKGWTIEVPLPIEDPTDFPGALRFFRDAPSGDSLIFEECRLRFFQ